MTTRLTENFYKHEFERSERAARLGIDNTIPPELTPNILRVATVMQKVRGILGNKVITVTSGYRGPELNTQTPGSSKTSAHMRALACDFVVQGMTPAQVCKALQSSVKDLGIDQLIFEFGQWTHIGLSVDGVAARNQVISIVSRDGKTVTLPGIAA